MKHINAGVNIDISNQFYKNKHYMEMSQHAIYSLKSALDLADMVTKSQPVCLCSQSHTNALPTTSVCTAYCLLHEQLSMPLSTDWAH